MEFCPSTESQQNLGDESGTHVPSDCGGITKDPNGNEVLCCLLSTPDQNEKAEKVALTHMSGLQCFFLICLDIANVGWDELTVCNLKPEISGIVNLIYSSSWRVGEFGGDGSVVESSVVLNFWPFGQTWNFKV